MPKAEEIKKEIFKLAIRNSHILQITYKADAMAFLIKNRHVSARSLDGYVVNVVDPEEGIIELVHPESVKAAQTQSPATRDWPEEEELVHGRFSRIIDY